MQTGNCVSFILIQCNEIGINCDIVRRRLILPKHYKTYNPEERRKKLFRIIAPIQLWSTLSGERKKLSTKTRKFPRLHLQFESFFSCSSQQKKMGKKVRLNIHQTCSSNIVIIILQKPQKKPTTSRKKTLN